jgi:hypothetical protein
MATSLTGGRLGKLVILLALCLALAGCKKSKITQENYDKIKTGMSLSEVEAILGEGTKEGGEGENMAAQVGVDLSGGVGAQKSAITEYVWEKGDKKITVSFVQGKVSNKRSSGL